MKRSDLETGKPCCYREAGFKDGKQCAAQGSEVIDEDTLPESCSDRHRVGVAELKTAFPECARICDNIFTAAIQRGEPLEILGDCLCVPGSTSTSKCKCTVRCKEGHKQVGGGAL